MSYILVALVAIVIKQEILLVLVGGVFVIEALSVIIQVVHVLIMNGLVAVL